MRFDLEKAWSGIIHRDFIEELEPRQCGALLRLLMVSSFADASITAEERVALGRATADLPCFRHAGWIDFDSGEAAEALEKLRSRWDESADAVLHEIRDDLGDDTTRRHAFRTTVEFLQSDGFVSAEADFVRDLGRRLGIEDDVIDFAIDDARE